jgi:hypothetical protein
VPDTEAPAAPLPTAPAEYLPEPDESVYVTAPPAPEEPQPIDWTAPSPIAEAALNDDPREPRSARTRGVPAAPAMVAAANGMALAATTAYEVGGLMALASTATVLLGGTGALVGRRRSTVRNRKAAAAGAAKTLGATNRAANARTGAGRSGAGAGNVSGGGRAGGGRGRDTAGHTRGGHSAAGHRAGGLDSRPSGARAESGGPGTGGRRAAGNGLPGASAAPMPGGRAGVPGQGARATGGRQAAAPGKGGMLARIADRLAGGTGKSGPKKKSDGPKNKPDGPKKTDRAKKNDKPKSTDQTDPSSPADQTPASRTRRSAAAAARLAKRAAARTGRLGAEGLRRSKPYRDKAAATVRRAAAKTGGAGWDATAALTRGVLAALRHRDLRTGWERLREVWRRRRQDRATRAARKNAAKTQDTAAPTVADTVRRPSTAMTARTTTAAGASMSGHHFLASATEMARAASAYDPTGMLQVGQDFAGLQESLELVAQSMKISTDKADAKQPLDPRIIEMMRGIYQLQMKAAQLASELPAAFEQLHQVDLQRLRNPRKGAAGERMWDVSTNL